MKLRLRLLIILIKSYFGDKLKPTDESICSFRVLFNDVDVSRMTNDRYQAIMDLGRIDLISRTGLLTAMVKKKLVPTVGAVAFRFRYPLKLFQRYQLHTRVLYWDDKAFYFEQKFLRLGRVVCTGYVSASILAKGKPLEPVNVLELVGESSAHITEEAEVINRFIEFENTAKQTRTP